MMEHVVIGHERQGWFFQIQNGNLWGCQLGKPASKLDGRPISALSCALGYVDNQEAPFLLMHSVSGWLILCVYAGTQLRQTLLTRSDSPNEPILHPMLAVTRDAVHAFYVSRTAHGDTVVYYRQENGGEWQGANIFTGTSLELCQVKRDPLSADLLLYLTHGNPGAYDITRLCINTTSQSATSQDTLYQAKQEVSSFHAVNIPNETYAYVTGGHIYVDGEYATCGEEAALFEIDGVKTLRYISGGTTYGMSYTGTWHDAAIPLPDETRLSMTVTVPSESLSRLISLPYPRLELPFRQQDVPAKAQSPLARFAASIAGAAVPTRQPQPPIPEPLQSNPLYPQISIPPVQGIPSMMPPQANPQTVPVVTAQTVKPQQKRAESPRENPRPEKCSSDEAALKERIKQLEELTQTQKERIDSLYIALNALEDNLIRLKNPR